MTGLTTDTDLVLNLFLLEQELDVFPCDDPRHAKGESYHTVGADAEFLVVNPCCSDRGLVCRTRAAYLKYGAATIRCWKCRHEWSPGEYRFIPLPGVMPL